MHASSWLQLVEEFTDQETTKWFASFSTCGLAEEDDVKPGKAPVKKAVKSACGNVRLS